MDNKKRSPPSNEVLLEEKRLRDILSGKTGELNAGKKARVNKKKLKALKGAVTAARRELFAYREANNLPRLKSKERPKD